MTPMEQKIAANLARTLLALTDPNDPRAAHQVSVADELLKKVANDESSPF